MSGPSGLVLWGGVSEGKLEDEREEWLRRKKKVRLDTNNFSDGISRPVRDESWIQTDEKVASPKSYRESLLQNVNSRVSWWEWSKGEEEEQSEDYGVETDFAKVLNPSDGISIDATNPQCPKFCFEEKEKERLWKPFGRTLVIKLSGRQPSYGFMVKKLRQLWERKGSIDLFYLQNDFYLVNFQREKDYMEALTGGPWVINDAYLNVARWKPDFSLKNERIETVVAWVRLPDFPAPLFDKKFLLNLGNVIGKAIKLDIHTAHRARGKFSRMCIELDLTKPLVPEFKVEGQTLSIVYESLGLLCTKCGMFGHVKDGCEYFQRKKCETRMESGSRFTVLEEEAIGEGLHKEPVENGNLVNDQEEVLEKEPKKQGKKTNMGDGKMSSRGFKVKIVNSEEQRGKMVTEGKVKKVPYQGKVTEERIPLKDVQEVQMSAECVPETNLEVYRNRGVGSCVKENLHPGELLSGVNCNADMEMETSKNEEEVEDIGACSGMAYGKKYATLELANDRRGAANKGVTTVIRDMRDQFLHCNVRLGGANLLFTAIYANPNVQRWHGLWEDLLRISEGVNVPWLLGGDFNEIKSPLEQKGGGRVNETRCRRFNDWIQDCKLLDIEANGPLFTWRGPKWEGLERVFKQLDRCLCNSLWQETFAGAEVRVVPRVGSDHHPIVVMLEEEKKGFLERPFRFQATWLLHEQFAELMRHNWPMYREAHSNLSVLQRSLVNWNKEFLSGKYSRSRNLMTEASSKQSDSKLWKNLVKIWPKILENVYWSVGNGEDVHF
ncbi:hypothetical protein K1719_026622 [Acacia pycnantha]|nr:hypothetical protein K1719_026622 [Acacia pycnantha]